MPLIRVSITVETSHLHRYDEIVLRCQDAGLTVERRMRVIGVVAGSIETSRLPALCSIEGVRDVEPSRELRCLDTASRRSKL